MPSLSCNNVNLLLPKNVLLHGNQITVKSQREKAGQSCVCVKLPTRESVCVSTKGQWQQIKLKNYTNGIQTASSCLFCTSLLPSFPSFLSFPYFSTHLFSIFASPYLSSPYFHFSPCLSFPCHLFLDIPFILFPFLQFPFLISWFFLFPFLSFPFFALHFPFLSIHFFTPHLPVLLPSFFISFFSFPIICCFPFLSSIFFHFLPSPFSSYFLCSALFISYLISFLSAHLLAQLTHLVELTNEDATYLSLILLYPFYPLPSICWQNGEGRCCCRSTAGSSGTPQKHMTRKAFI